MKIYIGENRVVKINKNKCERLDDGRTSTNEVYRINNDVYKFFYSHVDEGIKNMINKNQYFLDCHMDLKVIKMLDNLIYDKNRTCIGTHTTYVDGINEEKEFMPYILKMKKNQFLESFYLLQSDLEQLTKHKIAAYDLYPYNSILKNGILYHIDYGYFNFCNNPLKNNQLLDEYIYELLGSIYEFMGYQDICAYIFPEQIFEYIKKEMNETETIKTFVKKII